MKRNHLVAASAAVILSAISYAHASGPLTFLSRYSSTLGSEIPTFDPLSKRAFTVAGSTVEVLNLTNPAAPTLIGTITPGIVAPAGTELIPNSVAVRNGLLAASYAVRNTTTGAQLPGRVAFFNASNGTFLNSVEVGALPDMITFTPDGTKLLSANEGEPNSYGQANSFDPEGSISVIDLSTGVASATVTTASFTSFNSQVSTLRAAGVRIYGPNATVAQDLEPEYIAISPDGTKAFVTLQENNAIATVDIATSTVTNIRALGLKNHNLPGNGIDPSDRDVNGTAAGGGKISIRQVPVFGIYQPDAVAAYSVNGQTFLVTANEGDARSYTGFNEEARVGDSGYVLDPTAFPNASTLKQAANLGRLTVTTASGNTDGDGDFDQIVAFGGRSFSIWNADSGALVFDSGDQLEQITASLVPTLFNSEGTTATFDTRSDNKGPEPEGVVLGEVNGRTLAFIGLERIGGVMVFDVTNPLSPDFLQYINTGAADRGPEGLAFVSGVDSPLGVPLLLVSNEVSFSTTIFAIPEPSALGLLAPVSAMLARRRR